MGLPVVLFDLDGTLIDSGAIILASFQHAARTVLHSEVPANEILSRVGGTSLLEQMAAIDPDHVDDLVRVYREHNAPLADTLEAFEGILDVLERLRDEGRRLGVVTAKRRESLDLAPNVRAVAPLGYLDFAALASQARAILTDSGGLQKEAYWYGVPCVTMRPSTEWVDTVELGANVLVDDDPERIAAAATEPQMPAELPQLYGDGHASERIAEVLVTLRP